jgi:hypothetical protein
VSLFLRFVWAGGGVVLSVFADFSFTVGSRLRRRGAESVDLWCSWRMMMLT